MHTLGDEIGDRIANRVMSMENLRGAIGYDPTEAEIIAHGHRWLEVGRLEDLRNSLSDNDRFNRYDPIRHDRMIADALAGIEQPCRSAS